MNVSAPPVTTQLAALRLDVGRDQRDRILDAVGLCDRFCVVDTPIGPRTIAFNDHGVVLISAAVDAEAFTEAFRRRRGNRALRPARRPPRGVVTALRTGRGRTVPTDLRSLSEFQRQVLAAARDIPAGEVRPYQWIAERIGRPKAVRAVGTALGTNPVPLIIPCHRVIRGDGQCGGYVFGGDQKEALLRSEGANLDEVAELNGRGVRYVASATTGVFCHPSCHQARRITSGHRVLVHDRAEADRLGLRPCRSCQPVPAAA
jgi:O-6-methylguanine DNA methyltransferase